MGLLFSQQHHTVTHFNLHFEDVTKQQQLNSGFADTASLALLPVQISQNCKGQITTLEHVQRLIVNTSIIL